MNEAELKSIWQSYDSKINKVLAINKQQLFELQSQKADLKIRSFQRSHILVMLLGVLWSAFLAFLVFHSLDKIYLTVSLSILLLFNVFAVLLYLRHIVILGQITGTDSIAETQARLASVYHSYTNSGRILLLQTPFYCTWWYTADLIQSGGILFWTIQFLVVGLFTGLSIFLFRKLSPSNPSEKWKKISDKYFGAEKLRKAMDFLKEIEE
jgi:hypothetical protein